MIAFHARLVFLAFVGLSAVIAYNAVYLQDGPQRGGFAADIKSLQSRSSKATASTRRGSRPRSRTAGKVKRETVRSVQKQLSAKGYQTGPVDGVPGLLTRAAVMAFQHDSKLAVTGEVSEGLLKQVIFGASPAPASADGKKQEIPEQTTALIKAVQQILAKMGYDPGPVDGIMGTGTRRAIRSFEEEQKIPAKGRISGRLLKELLRVTGAKLAGIPSG